MLLFFMDLRGGVIGGTERFAGHLVPMADITLTAAFLFGLLLLFAPGLVASGAAEPAAANLKPNTVAAFNGYVQLTDARNNDELRRETNRLWIDSFPGGERAQANPPLKHPHIKIRHLQTRANP